MEPQQYPYPPPPPAAPEKPAWSTKKTTAVTAVAAAAVLAIGGVAVANSGDDSGSSSSQGPGGFPGRGAAPAGGGLTGALHGTYVAQADGSYVTRVFQTGEVTAASATSVTVKSTDGYTKSYTVSSSTSVNGGQSTAADIETGHTATVTATEAAAATSILDQSLAGTGGGQGFPGGAPGQDGTGQGGTGQDGTGQGSAGQGGAPAQGGTGQGDGTTT
jgi:hypothetical protein